MFNEWLKVFWRTMDPKIVLIREKYELILFYIIKVLY